MFARRAFCSAGIPPRMYSALHIQSAQHAQRVLPSFVALPSLIGRQAALGSSLAVAPCGALMSSEALTELGVVMTEAAMAVSGLSAQCGRMQCAFTPLADSMIMLRVVSLPYCWRRHHTKD